MKQSAPLAIAIAITMVITLVSIPTLVGMKIQAQPRPTQLPVIPEPPTTSNHLPVHTVQDDHLIVTTVTKSGESPQGPVIIIPPGPENGNGSIITPGENITKPGEGNVTVIAPGGNVTELPGNITNIGNDTVIIAPPDRNITETPANVTVIDPKPTHPIVLPNETNIGKPCTCNNQSQPAPIPPVTITPAPGQNVTTLPHPAENLTAPPVLPQFPTNPPANNQSESGNGSGTGSTGNQTGNTTGNETQTNPPSNATGTNSTNTQPQPPHATQLPASVVMGNMFPGLTVNKVNFAYTGPNSQFLNK